MKRIIIASILAPAALGYGMAAAAIHSLATVSAPPAPVECGTPGEDAQRCSREGAQFTAWPMAGDGRGSGRVIADATSPDCPRGSRDCFPKDRVGLL